MSLDYADLHLVVAGEAVESTRRESLAVVDPWDGREIGRLPIATEQDLDRALEAAKQGCARWRKVSAYERGGVLRRAAAEIRAEADALAVQLTLEQGKPLAQAKAEWLSSADFLDWYAEEGRRAYGRLIPSRVEGATLAVRRDPVGVVAAFAPWNFPASQVARKLAPALAAGCSVILKPSEETPATGLAFARLLSAAGLPDGVLQVVFGDPARISEHLIRSPIVRKVSFTGSTAVGKLIASLASEGLKRVTLELGGHAPVLVFDDADVEQTAAAAIVAKFRNAGQVCTAPTRFLVQAPIHDRFVEALTERARALRLGNGRESGVDIGPLANGRRREAMEQLTQDAVDRGAVVRCGGVGSNLSAQAWTPTVLTDVPTDARVLNEEPFGPIATIAPFESLDQAVAEANRLPYGLAAYAFTQDRRRLGALREGVESGLLGLNTFSVTWAETPFGGIKESGYGSEGGPEGLDAYLQTRFVSEA